jgi:hypothetical protein
MQNDYVGITSSYSMMRCGSGLENRNNGLYGWGHRGNGYIKGDCGFRLCETMESIRMVETGLKRIV